MYIRELQNFIERALIPSVGADLNLDLPDELNSSRLVSQPPSSALALMTDAQFRELERSNMEEALKASGGKLLVKAARPSF